MILSVEVFVYGELKQLIMKRLREIKESTICIEQLQESLEMFDDMSFCSII
jgi:hypothetical protein